MSVQKLLNTQPRTQGFPVPSSGGTQQPAGASFQELLSRSQPAAAAQNAAPLSHQAFAKDDLLSSLAGFSSDLVGKMKLAKEKEEEQEAWDQLMKYLDAWIESLREEGDVHKIAQAHAALASLQVDGESDRPDIGDYLLQQIEASLI